MEMQLSKGRTCGWTGGSRCNRAREGLVDGLEDGDELGD